MTDVDQYDYELPRELIAQQPLANRADARLLVVHRQRASIRHAHVRDLSEFVAPGDCLVLNDTKVIPARLVGFRTATEGRWQGLFLSADERGNWKLLSKTRGRLTADETVTLVDYHASPILRLRMLADLGAGQWAARPESDEPALKVLERVGRVPLPHYIRDGEMCAADTQTYQTVYAQHPGSVAAPTAGLHFTDSLLTQLGQAGVAIARVTLHVGVGTFRPISVRQLDQHQMHTEWGEITEENVRQITEAKQCAGRVIAVGTTTMRILETAAADKTLAPWSGNTDLFIRPPFRFHVVDGLMTNFHLARSTLLVLVRTFGGDALIRGAYEAAIAERYRFYSYGDAMLVL